MIFDLRASSLSVPPRNGRLQLPPKEGTERWNMRMDTWCAVLDALRGCPSSVLRIRLFCGEETLILSLGCREIYGELSMLLRESWCAANTGDMTLEILSQADM